MTTIPDANSLTPTDPDFVTTGFRLWGWFDDPNQTDGTYEPPHDAPCPYCFAPMTADDVRTHNLMEASSSYAKRSYFFRTHRTCDNDAEKRGEDITGRILDAIAKAGD